MLINSLLQLLQLHICVLEKLCHRNQKVLKRPRKVLENRSTFEMYLSTSIRDFSEMFLSTFQILYKVQMYLSTKYSCPALNTTAESFSFLFWSNPSSKRALFRVSHSISWCTSSMTTTTNVTGTYPTYP